MDSATLARMLPKRYESRDIRLNKELEKALKQIRKQQRESGPNREWIIDDVGWECVSCLGDMELIDHVRSEKGGEIDRIELTIDGRNYFAEKRRHRRERYGTVVVGGLIGGVFTVLGTVLGFVLALI